MKQFKRVYVEITNCCNLSCSFCPQTKRPPEFITVDNFNKTVEQIKPFTEYIYLHVKGEPFLHPNLEQLLDICCKNGLKVTITTNGTLINKVRDILINTPALRQINFSLHSFDGNEKSLISIEKYIGDIISFVKDSNASTNIINALRLWNLDQDNVTNLQKQRNRHILELIEKEFSLTYKIEEKIQPGRGIKLSDRIYLNQDYEFKWPNLNEIEEDFTGFCYGLKSQIAILVDGTVVPCCLDGEGVINLGNIHKKDFFQIINSDRALKIIEGFSRRVVVEELCRKCDYRRRFGK